MHHVAYAEIAAAVSNAGGLGIITALSQPNPEALRTEIRKCRKLTSKPFGVNLTLLPMLAPPDYGAYAQVIIDEGIKIVETAGNNPAAFIKKFKENGIIVLHKCVSIRHALTAERLGVDVISMDGFECGGHPGEDDVGNWVLLAKAATALKIPFIASGGVGTGSQLAAALALGADGVNMGTRFMATKECTIHENIKKALVNGDEKSTTHIFRTLKNTERVYKNKTADLVREKEKEKPGDFSVIREYVSGAKYKESFYVTGDIESSVWSCGQVMGLIKDIPSCQELIERMVLEAYTIISSKLPLHLSKL
jgi:nitronate monooxygenase